MTAALTPLFGFHFLIGIFLAWLFRVSIVASLIGNLVNSVDPSMIVLGGGVVLNNAEFRKLLIHHTRKFIFCDDVKSIKILLSKLKVDTGVIGAAALYR